MRRRFPILPRVSSLIRLLWVAVAALHAWLIARRLATGNLADWFALAKLILCFAAIVYCTLKVWRVATIFDSAPRRVVAFALLLLLGHWLIATPQTREAALGQAPLIALTTLAILPAREATARFLIKLARLLMAFFPIQPAAQPRPAFCFVIHPWLHALAAPPRALFRRPPPTLA